MEKTILKFLKIPIFVSSFNTPSISLSKIIFGQQCRMCFAIVIYFPPIYIYFLNLSFVWVVMEIIHEVKCNCDYIELNKMG